MTIISFIQWWDIYFIELRANSNYLIINSKQSQILKYLLYPGKNGYKIFERKMECLLFVFMKKRKTNYTTRDIQERKHIKN